jgi:hypothetical protein
MGVGEAQPPHEAGVPSGLEQHGLVLFAFLSVGDKKIAYKPTERYINAAHLSKLYGMAQSRLFQLFSKRPQIHKRVRRGNPHHLQGTYISYENARTLCAHFSVSSDPVERLIDPAAVAAPAGHDADNANIADKVVEEGDEITNAYITEPCYENGSYLAPAGTSHLELLKRPSLPNPACGAPDAHDATGGWIGFERDGFDVWSQ